MTVGTMISVESKVYEEKADRWALALSFLCLLHCLFTPVLLLLFPAFEVFHHGSHFHEISFFVLLAIAAVAFYRGFRLHKKPQVLVVALAGFATLWAGLILHEYAFVITSVGSGFLIIAHLWNMKFCRCACCEDHPQTAN